MAHDSPGTTAADGTAGAHPTVSVIVPVHNGVDRLHTCLAALTEQDYPADRVEVLVVDNASTEDVSSALPPGDPRFHVLHEPRRGSYVARNTGAAMATGEVLAFTDADCIPRPDWLTSGVTTLLEEPAPDAVGGAINLVFRHGDRPHTPPEHYESLHGFEQQKYVERFSFAATANLFVRAATFRRVGAFNADLQSGGDLDWGTRLGRAGGRLVYAPATIIDHPSRPTWSELTHKSIRVAHGLADLAADKGRRTVLARAYRELRGGLAVWIKVWRATQPHRPLDKVKYAAAYSYVSVIRTVIRLRRLVLGGRAPVARG